MPSSTTVVLLQFVPLLRSARMAFQPFVLATEKGRQPAPWTAPGLIPFVNMFCIGDLVGAARRKHDEKLHELIRLLKRSAAAE